MPRKRSSPRKRKSSGKRRKSPGLVLLILILAVLWQVIFEEEPPSPPPVDVERGIAYGGLPRDVNHPCSRIEELRNSGFIVGYCNELKNPAWVVYQVFGSEQQESDERPSRFSTDERTSAKVSHRDYTRSGYDRGHMAPNHAIATRYGREAQLETFLMSNICPQKPDLNRKVWRELEQIIADRYAPKLGQVWVVTGPLFEGRPEKLKSGVVIPSGFYKILVDEQNGRPRTQAFILPQEVSGDEPVERFLTSVDEVERRTGLDFLPQLDAEASAAIESSVSPGLW